MKQDEGPSGERLSDFIISVRFFSLFPIFIRVHLRASVDKGIAMTMQPKQTTRSEEVIRKHKEYLWPAVTNFYQQPLVADHGSMQYVWDVEGRRFVDFAGQLILADPMKAYCQLRGLLGVHR